MAIREAAEQPKLVGGALGLGAQLFQAITHMAPVAGVVFSVQYMASQGGATLPLGWLLATIACTLTALCLVQLVRKIRSAGGYFVIHSVPLGHAAGFTTSWMYFLYDPLIPAAAVLLWGVVAQDFFSLYLGVFIPWYLLGLVMAAALTITTYVGIRESGKITIIFGALETIVFGLLGILLIIKAGGDQPLVAFTPAASPAIGGVFFAMIFAILSFIGFEAGVPLAEESYNAKRSLIISIMVSCVGIGLFYVMMGYATVAGWGYTDPESFSKDLSGAQQPFFTLATRAFGALGPLAMFLLITNSLYAVGIAGTNAVTRVYYSLGRAGIFPAALGRIHPRTRTPTNAILLQGALAVIIAYLFGFALGVEPIVAYGLHGLLMTIGAVIVYMMTNLSCFMLYRKQYPNEFSVLNHLIIPVLATVVFIPPLAASLFPETLSVIGMGFSNAYPVTLALPISIVWAVIGVVVYLWLRSARPGALERMANEMAVVELVGEDQDPSDRATTNTPVR